MSASRTGAVRLVAVRRRQLLCVGDLEHVGITCICDMPQNRWHDTDGSGWVQGEGYEPPS